MTVVPQIATSALTRAVVAATMTVCRMCFLLLRKATRFSARALGPQSGTPVHQHGRETARDGLRAAALQFLIEALGIERVRGGSDAGQNRQSDKRGNDGLHDGTPF